MGYGYANCEDQAIKACHTKLNFEYMKCSKDGPKKINSRGSEFPLV